MIKLALKYVRNPATAEEVVQETWLVVVRDIDTFEGRGPVKNWIYAILVNLAKARGVRDARVVPLPLGDEHRAELGEVSRDLVPLLHGRRGGSRLLWDRQTQLERTAHDAACDRETLAVVVSAIKTLPVNQRAVIYLRDVRGLAPEEACAILAISDGHLRVLLHRARRRVCAAVRDHLERTSTEPLFADRIHTGARG
jgi:RNA polymerase sigma-70 factor (ECF subfamily)